MSATTPPIAVTADSAIHRGVLPNGVTVLTEEMPHARTAAVAVLTRQGSRDERPHENGLSHFLEHFVFRGTKPWARMPSGRSLRDIAIETDLLGGEVDAWTGRESTCYQAEVAAEQFARAALLVMDLVARPSFPADAMERERAVIREEMRGYEEDPAERAFMNAASRWWPRHPLGRRVEGTPKTLASFTLEGVERFWQAKHAGSNLISCASGRVSHEEHVALATEALGGLPRERPDDGRPAPAPARGLKVEQRRRLEQAQILLTLPGLPARHPALPALAVVVTALGGGMSSRLWQRIREEEGLAYNLSLEHEGFRDCGRLLFHAVTAPANAPRALRLVAEEMQALRSAPLPDDEFERIRQVLRSGIVLGTETAGDRLDDLAWSELVFGRPVTLDERLRRLERLSPADALEAGAALLSDPRRLLCVVTPAPDGIDDAAF